MSATDILNLTATITMRPLWQRVLRFPFLWRRHYRTMRRYQESRVLCLYAAWVLAGVTVKIGKYAGSLALKDQG